MPLRHHLIALRAGEVHAAGPPTQVVDVALIEAVLGLRSQIVPDPVTGTPMVVPICRVERAVVARAPAPATTTRPGRLRRPPGRRAV